MPQMVAFYDRQGIPQDYSYTGAWTVNLLTNSQVEKNTTITNTLVDYVSVFYRSVTRS